jgi:hypothetical protein
LPVAQGVRDSLLVAGARVERWLFQTLKVCATFKVFLADQ